MASSSIFGNERRSRRNSYFPSSAHSVSVMSTDGIDLGLSGSYRARSEVNDCQVLRLQSHPTDAGVHSHNMHVGKVKPKRPPLPKLIKDDIPPVKPPRKSKTKLFLSPKAVGYQRFSNDSDTSPFEAKFPLRRSEYNYHADLSLVDDVFTKKEPKSQTLTSKSGRNKESFFKFSTLISRERKKSTRANIHPVISSPILTPISQYPDLLPCISKPRINIHPSNPDILTDLLKSKRFGFQDVQFNRSQTLRVRNHSYSPGLNNSVNRRGSSIFSKLSRRSSLILNQRDPVDQSLLNRKFSHGSEDEDDKKKKDKKTKKSKAPSRHGSDAKNADKVRSKLKKLIGRRPTMEMLQEKGIIKENVFGCPLQKLAEKENTIIPNFVQMCVGEVEKRGLTVDGIYRVSGNLSHVQKLRYSIDRDEHLDLSEPQWEDIHVITGALKMFLRELPEPLIPFNYFDKFIDTCVHYQENNCEKLSETRQLIKSLPKVNQETLKYLMNHFRNVVEHSSSNRMQVQNIAIVFGPTLLLKPPIEPNTPHHPDPSGSNMAVYMMYQNQIVDYMLTEFDNLFK